VRGRASFAAAILSVTHSVSYGSLLEVQFTSVIRSRVLRATVPFTQRLKTPSHTPLTHTFDSLAVSRSLHPQAGLPVGRENCTPLTNRLLLDSQSASLTLRCSSSEEQGTHVQLPDHTQCVPTRMSKGVLQTHSDYQTTLSVPAPKNKGVSLTCPRGNYQTAVAFPLRRAKEFPLALRWLTRPHTVYLLRRTREFALTTRTTIRH